MFRQNKNLRQKKTNKNKTKVIICKSIETILILINSVRKKIHTNFEKLEHLLSYIQQAILCYTGEVFLKRLSFFIKTFIYDVVLIQYVYVGILGSKFQLCMCMKMERLKSLNVVNDGANNNEQIFQVAILYAFVVVI